MPNRISGSPDARLLRAFGLPVDAPYSFLSEEPLDENGAEIWPMRYEYEPAECPKTCSKVCAKRNHFTRNGCRTTDYVHLNTGSTPRFLRVEIRRWLAECAEAVPPAPLPGMAKGHLMTIPAQVHVVKELKAGTPVDFLARTLGTSESTIRRLKKEFMPCPELGLRIDPNMKSFKIDEIKIGGKYYTTFHDGTHRRYMGMVRGMREKQIKAALIAIRETCHIERATADFSRGYIAILRRYFPGIVITGDKQHLLEKVKKFMSALRRVQEKVLTGEQAKAIREALGVRGLEEGRDLENRPGDDERDEEVEEGIEKKATEWSPAGRLKRDARLFNAAYVKLDADQRKRIAMWLEIVPALKPHWFLLQRLYSLLNKGRGREKSCKRLRKILWQFEEAHPQQARTILGFFDRNWDAITAYFWTGETNAFAESMHSRMRKMIWLANGLAAEEVNRRMWERYGVAAEASETAPRKEEDHKTRHGLHRRKRWPLESSPSDRPQMDFSFD